MSTSAKQSVSEFYAQTYADSVSDWPGEMDFYHHFASEVKAKGAALLEVACGTGRVAIRLAQEGVETVGLDLSPNMLAIAQEKSSGLKNIRFVEANMCDFDLSEMFGLVIIPGHSFQNLNTAAEQVACLECIYRHLLPGGRLVVHLDHQEFDWLGELVGEKGGVFEPAEQFEHPQTGQHIHTLRAWEYEPATQTAVCTTKWEAVGSDGQVVERWQTEPVRLHCVFRFEMEHLLARVGFTIEAVYGDFFRNPLADKSAEMVWIACKP